MATTLSFQPNDRATLTISVTTTTQNVALISPQVSGGFQARVCNVGPSLVFVRFAKPVVSGGSVVDPSSVAATSADIPIPAGNTETFTLDSGTTRIACLTPASTATLYVTTGEGL